MRSTHRTNSEMAWRRPITIVVIVSIVSLDSMSSSLRVKKPSPNETSSFCEPHLNGSFGSRRAGRQYRLWGTASDVHSSEVVPTWARMKFLLVTDIYCNSKWPILTHGAAADWLVTLFRNEIMTSGWRGGFAPGHGQHAELQGGDSTCPEPAWPDLLGVNVPSHLCCDNVVTHFCNVTLANLGQRTAECGAPSHVVF